MSDLSPEDGAFVASVLADVAWASETEKRLMEARSPAMSFPKTPCAGTKIAQQDWQLARVEQTNKGVDE